MLVYEIELALDVMVITARIDYNCSVPDGCQRKLQFVF
jgi:hypothetical protein